MRSRYSFTIKIAVTISLVIAFDRLFPTLSAGTCVGVFAFLWLIGLVAARPALRQPRLPEASAIAIAGLAGVALLYDPGLLAWSIFWAALSIAALLPRTDGFDDAFRWSQRLLLHAISGSVALLQDIAKLSRVRPRGRKYGIRGVAALLALPVLGTLLFVALFANANPVIGRWLSAIELPTVGQVLQWSFVALCVWPAFRPRGLVTRLDGALFDPAVRLPGTSLPSVLLALAMFNAVFALQNGLDLAFLWSGAPLPSGMSMTEYVHRGAYPLIFTALLAGFLVLTMLRPGSASAANPLARRLVALWVAQNLFLVASSALRTIQYVEYFLLTAWRIAALAWMALVATGLILVFWRILAGKSARWLINANALAATIVLLPCCFVDLDAIAATWNVRHAREVGGRGAPLDLCYLDSLGSAALLQLIEIEHRPLAPALIDQLRYLRETHHATLAKAQADWHSWTPRGAMRLAHARAALGPTPPHSAAMPQAAVRSCRGIEQDDSPAPPLTNAPAQ